MYSINMSPCCFYNMLQFGLVLEHILFFLYFYICLFTTIEFTIDAAC